MFLSLIQPSCHLDLEPHHHTATHERYRLVLLSKDEVSPCSTWSRMVVSHNLTNEVQEREREREREREGEGEKTFHLLI